MATVPSKVVDALIKVSACKFGGKTRGRFRISVKELEILCNRRVIYEDFLGLVAIEASQRGYLFARLDSTNYLFMKIGPLSGWRKATKALATENRVSLKRSEPVKKRKEGGSRWLSLNG